MIVRGAREGILARDGVAHLANAEVPGSGCVNRMSGDLHGTHRHSSDRERSEAQADTDGNENDDAPVVFSGGP